VSVDRTDPEVDDGYVHIAGSVNDGAEILQFRRYERAVSAVQTGQSRLSVAREVGPADAAHATAERPVCRHQMQLQTHPNHAPSALTINGKVLTKVGGVAQW